MPRPDLHLHAAFLAFLPPHSFFNLGKTCSYQWHPKAVTVLYRVYVKKWHPYKAVYVKAIPPAVAAGQGKLKRVLPQPLEARQRAGPGDGREQKPKSQCTGR